MADWQSVTEQVYGLLDGKKLDISKFTPEMFWPPYNLGFQILRDLDNRTAAAEKIGMGLYKAAQSAAEDADPSLEWHKLLVKAMRANKAGNYAMKVGKQWAEGKEVNPEDVMQLSVQLKDVANPDAVGLQSLDTVSDDFVPLIPSGWKAIDDHFGGIPHARPTVVGGASGEGKTWWSMRLLNEWMKEHPQDVAAVYSLEMTAEEWKYRVKNYFPAIVSAMKEGRVLISDRIVTADDIRIEVSSVQASITIIDYIDYIVGGDMGEQAYKKTNLKLNEMCRTLSAPTIVLHQFSATMQKMHPVPSAFHFYMGASNKNIAGLMLGILKVTPQNREQVQEKFCANMDYPYMMVGLKCGVAWKHGTPGAVALPEGRGLWSEQSGRWLVEGDVDKSKGTKLRRAADDD